MRIFVGDTRSTSLIARLRSLGWGRMFAESLPTPFEGEAWGFDNGAFGAWQRGEPFPVDRFWARLDRAASCDPPTIAVTPDRVAAGVESLAFSLDWLVQLPADWPWYLAVQDGMTPDDVAPVVGEFAGIFLGGSTRFKAQAGVWRCAATAWGVPFHYARAGVPSRIQHALAVGADSLDSSFPLWSLDRFDAFVRLLGGDDTGTNRLLPEMGAWMRGA